MSLLPGRLGSLTAHDVMTPHVITVNDADSLAEAIQALTSHRISGAPVVNDSGKLVGVLSLADLVRREGEEVDEQNAPLAHGGEAIPWALFQRTKSVKRPAEGTVAERMSRQVTSVVESAPLVEVARVMCSGHWHRVPVVDNQGNLTGIISTMDVLAAIVNAADERE